MKTCGDCGLPVPPYEWCEDDGRCELCRREAAGEVGFAP